MEKFIKQITEQINHIKAMKIEDIIGSSLVQKYALYALAILVILMLIKMCVTAKVQKKKRKAANYFKRFQEGFNRTKDIYETLNIVKAQYKKNTKDYRLLDKAIHYLDNSIARDYSTAFAPLEKYYNNPDINRVHRFAIFSMKVEAQQELEKRETV